MFDIAFWGYLLASLAYVLFGLYLGLGWRGGRPGGALILATAASAVWAAVCALQALVSSAWIEHLARLLDILRSTTWFGFVLVLLEPLYRERVRSFLWFGVVVVAVALFAVIFDALPVYSGHSPASIVLGSFLAMSVYGLVLVEQLYRGLPIGSRWGLKPLCLALAAGYIFELYFFADGFLFVRADPDVWAVRGIVFATVIPLIAISAARSPSWTLRIAVSREVIFHSTALAISGLYLLLIAAAGYYVRYVGGSWGRALQLTLLFGGLLLFGVLFFSGTQRAKLRVFLNKHLFPYRYDYRVEWQRFTQALSSAGDTLDLGQSVIKALADQVESSGGVLWLRNDEGQFRMHARLNHPASEAVEDAKSGLCRFLDEREWVINLEEFRGTTDHYDGLKLPHWLSTLPDAWLVVPLKSSGNLIGFVVLNTPRTAFEVNWEVLDLLKSAQRQAASYLAQMLAAEALLESRKFDSFNRMSAFVVHDLKNLVAQLSLMLKNAERHRNNPAFQDDMIETVVHVEARMRTLMKQLQEKTSADPRKPVDLIGMIERIAMGKRHQLPRVDVVQPPGTPLLVNAHSERLERIIGHVVQNALDACNGDGKVEVRVERLADESGAVVVEDSGKGMSETFMRDRLFKPFQTDKINGMGIGVFETQQYLKELGGSIRYESEVGRGTRASILLPLVGEAGCEEQALDIKEIQ
ncbi:MAG TPA: PEP-CTERM system histidine kinase PrsK [Rhodocyclaceae bacterium]|nr:PEP-CTERM system histidine kinase PrsK [Zoogloeaceae bacterium]HRD33062.1 PEP-CTERM system histidine kinase PrsK [Rhodocyclaceae bacterium]